MATKRKMLKCRGIKVQKQKPVIPLGQYLLFSGEKSRADIAEINQEIVEEELKEEKRIARRLWNSGDLRPGNGLFAFTQACKRRIKMPQWYRVDDHSERVRRYACCIADAMGAEPDMFRIIMNVSGFHDIGKTLIAQYLINKEDGTENGHGKDVPLTFDELMVLRPSHIEAGVRFVRLYANYMSELERNLTAWIIGGHHMAYNGKGSASGRGYFPQTIIQGGLGAHMKGRNIPLAARIVRCADVYSAIMENRFYLDKSRRFLEGVKGMDKDDAALGPLISVAGTDVDPELVKCLIMGRYDVDQPDAEAIVMALACREMRVLEEKGGDIDFSLDHVLSDDSFLGLLPAKTGKWDRPMDSQVLLMQSGH